MLDMMMWYGHNFYGRSADNYSKTLTLKNCTRSIKNETNTNRKLEKVKNKNFGVGSLLAAKIINLERIYRLRYADRLLSPWQNNSQQNPTSPVRNHFPSNLPAIAAQLPDVEYQRVWSEIWSTAWCCQRSKCTICLRKYENDWRNFDFSSVEEHSPRTSHFASSINLKVFSIWFNIFRGQYCSFTCFKHVIAFSNWLLRIIGSKLLGRKTKKKLIYNQFQQRCEPQSGYLSIRKNAMRSLSDFLSHVDVRWR